MQVMFSAVENKDEELANQVASDIEAAKEKGELDTDEVNYKHVGDGKVAITDKENGEVTIAEKAEGEEAYDLAAIDPDMNLEGFLHPAEDGVTPGEQKGEPAETVESHMNEGVIAPNMPCGGLNPEAGQEKTAMEIAAEGPQANEDMGNEEKTFSVYTQNTVVQKIFSDQDFCERIFSEVIESEKTAVVGDLKIEKVDGEEDTVVVTSESTGDQAKVTFDGPEMEVTELDQKEYSNEEQNLPNYLIGVEPINHVIVDAPVYSEEAAQELTERLQEAGVEAIQIFEDQESARDYGMQLLENLGVENLSEQVEEPEQTEFSDHTVYVTKFYSNIEFNNYMVKLFSEAVNEGSESQDEVKSAIESGEQVENDSEVITPIDGQTAIIEDKESGEFTKAVVDGDELDFAPISEEEANKLTENLVVEEENENEEGDDKEDEDDDDDENEEVEQKEESCKSFSNMFTNQAQTKFFSANEKMTQYMVRLFSEDAKEDEIEKAIESGETVETESEIITPISETVAVIEDKENGELTKAEVSEEDIDLEPISKEEVDALKAETPAEEGEKPVETPAEKPEEEETESDENNESEEEEPKQTEFSIANDPIMSRFFSDVVGVEEEAPAESGEDAAAQSVETIEDKALAAVQAIQDVASEAVQAIQEAKESPAPGNEEDLKEAQFSDKGTNGQANDPILTWIGGLGK